MADGTQPIRTSPRSLRPLVSTHPSQPERKLAANGRYRIILDECSLACSRPDLAGAIVMPMTYKVRLSEAGMHLFDRISGLNILLDEVKVPAGQVSRAPRYLSVALTNACELRCVFCYAPKHAAC